jgi:hypothetical protein
MYSRLEPTASNRNAHTAFFVSGIYCTSDTTGQSVAVLLWEAWQQQPRQFRNISTSQGPIQSSLPQSFQPFWLVQMIKGVSGKEPRRLADSWSTMQTERRKQRNCGKTGKLQVSNRDAGALEICSELVERRLYQLPMRGSKVHVPCQKADCTCDRRLRKPKVTPEPAETCLCSPANYTCLQAAAHLLADRVNRINLIDCRAQCSRAVLPYFSSNIPTCCHQDVQTSQH